MWCLGVLASAAPSVARRPACMTGSAAARLPETRVSQPVAGPSPEELRILHVTDASSAGVLTAVTTLSREQARLPQVRDVSLAYVPRPDSPPADQIRQMASKQVNVIQWSRRTDALRLVALGVRLIAAIRAGGYDVIHVHASRAGFLGRIIAAAVGRHRSVFYSPHCFAFADNGRPASHRKIYLALERLAGATGATFVAVSESEAALTRSLFPRAKVGLVTNAIDHRELAAWTRSTQAGGSRRNEIGRNVVHIGRIAEQKDPELFGKIADILLNSPFRLPQTAFTWLGDGDRSLLGNARVGVSGWLTPDQLRRRLVDADVVLFTSCGEGLPMALLEAQGLGIPIVGSNVPGVADVVDHGNTGFLGNGSAELAGYVRQILTDGPLRSRMCQAAQVRGLRYFDIDTLAQRSLNVYFGLACDTSGATARRQELHA